MASNKAELLSASLFNSNKKNPFRKSNFTRSYSTNPGDQSPDSAESKKIKGRVNQKNRHLGPDLVIEEGFQLLESADEAGKRKGDDAFQNTEGELSPVKPIQLPEVFDKYTLTTDFPFSGIRTTKAKIEPIKPVDNIPKTSLNPRIGDDIFGIVAAKKFFTPLKSKNRLLMSQSKVVAGPETKSNMDRNGNSDKESPKVESPSKNSLEIEADNKEREAFVTEVAHRSQLTLEKHASGERSQDSDNRDIEEYFSQSEEKNKDKNPRPRRDIKTSHSPDKSAYDPWAVLNKIKNKEFMIPKSYDTNLDSPNKTENESISKSKSSQPRDFTVMRSKKMNLFEGIPYVPYDIFLRQDSNMQNVMIKDLLKILLDKGKSLKNLFQDNYRMNRIMKNIEEAEQSALNLHTEETIGLLNAVSSLIMQEFRDSIDKIGIKPSPIFDNPNLKVTGFENEAERFFDNCHLFLDSTDHLRDCVDCYYVMSRQKDRKPISDLDCSDLLQFIARARYNLGQLYEAFRVIEKHVDAKSMWDAQNDPTKANEKLKKWETQKVLPKDNNKLKADTYRLLAELLQNKFNINKNRTAATRESKVVLNQEAEDEKFLTILQNQKQLKKRAGKALVDNRKLIILKRLLNPIEDPQIQAAIKIAQDKTQVQLGRDLIEYMATKAKVFDMKANINKDLPLKHNLEKILSNKNLTHINFNFRDSKEQQDILKQIASNNKSQEMKEVVNNVFSHTKTKRHLGCLFDQEALSHEDVHINNKKLPKLQNQLRKTFLQTR